MRYTSGGGEDRNNIPLAPTGGGVAGSVMFRIKISAGVAQAKRTVKEVLFPINAEGVPGIGTRTGYGKGTGGNVRMRLCKPQADGDADLSQVLGSETFAFSTRWSSMNSRYGSSSTRQVIYAVLDNTVVMDANASYCFVVDSPEHDVNNYISLNPMDHRSSPAATPTDSNSWATPTAPGAMAGFDTTDAIALTDQNSEPRTWEYAPDTRFPSGIAWSATAGTQTAAPSTPYYGYCPFTGGNDISNGTCKFPIPDQALNIPITHVDTISGGGNPGTVTVELHNSNGTLVTSRTVNPSGIKAHTSLGTSITPTISGQYILTKWTGTVVSMAQEGGMTAYGLPPHSPDDHDWNVVVTGSGHYATYEVAGCSPFPAPFHAPLAATGGQAVPLAGAVAGKSTPSASLTVPGHGGPVPLAGTAGGKSTVAAALSAGAIASGYKGALLAKGPSSYWRFGDTGATAVDEKGVISPTIPAGVTKNQAGLISNDANKSFLFADAGGVDMGDRYGMSGAGQKFSLVAWIDPDTIDTVSRRIFSKEDATGEGIYLVIRTANLQAARVSGAGAVYDVANYAPTWDLSKPLYFVVVTYDGVNLKLYTDGVLRATTPSAATIISNTNSFVVGAKYDGSSGFIGRIDEPAVFNGLALTQQDVTDLWNAGIASGGGPVALAGSSAGKSTVGAPGGGLAVKRALGGASAGRSTTTAALPGKVHFAAATAHGASLVSGSLTLNGIVTPPEPEFDEYVPGSWADEMYRSVLPVVEE